METGEGGETENVEKKDWCEQGRRIHEQILKDIAETKEPGGSRASPP